MTALDDAYTAYRTASKARTTEAEMEEWVLTLGDWDVFSNWQICAITGVERPRVDALNPRPGRNEGGRLNPATLTLMVDIRAAHGMEISAKRETRRCVKLGTSGFMIAKLTGVPKSTVYRWLAK